jgi:hypothetical protein
VLARKLHVDDRADDLHDLAGGSLRRHVARFLSQTAAAPPTISLISLVIAAWRALL